MRTIADLGDATTRYHAIVLYTDPDRDALFVRQSDEAFCIGPAQ